MDWIQVTWNNLLDQYDPRVIEFVGTLVVQVLSFYLASTTYVLLTYIAPKFSYRHKIQPIPKQPTKEDIKHCLGVVLRNQLLAISLQLAKLAIAPVEEYSFRRQIPSLSEFVVHFSLMLLLREVAYYYSHRLFHNKRFYAKYHKQHHKFITPIAFAAQYAHPLEHIVVNISPIFLPQIILRAHILTFWAFLWFELVETSTVHSGYDFFHSAAKAHDLHHEKFMINFGSIGLLDWLHGTDRIKDKQT